MLILMNYFWKVNLILEVSLQLIRALVKLNKYFKFYPGFRKYSKLSKITMIICLAITNKLFKIWNKNKISRQNGRIVNETSMVNLLLLIRSSFYTILILISIYLTIETLTIFTITIIIFNLKPLLIVIVIFKLLLLENR